MEVLFGDQEGGIFLWSDSARTAAGTLQGLFCVSVPVSDVRKVKQENNCLGFRVFDQFVEAKLQQLLFVSVLTLCLSLWPCSPGLQHSSLNPSITQTLRYSLRLSFFLCCRLSTVFIVLFL